MIVCILVSILLHHRYIEAAPVLLLLGRDSDIRQAKRTLFGIIWSCLSTIIICAWTAVHPNVPPPNQWKGRWNRLNTMFWMIIAPELVLAWAVRQHFGAKEIRDVYNRRNSELPEWKKWTLKHGHLLQMGGFCLIDSAEKDVEPGTQNRTVLTFDYFQNHPDIDSIIPEISAAEIDDRSKGDALSKVIAILQTTWFIVQCISRVQQRLAVTELELVTLALASLNAVTFGIWWHKPLGVQEPLKIYLKTEVPLNRVPENAASPEEDHIISYDDVLRDSWRLCKGMVEAFFRLPYYDIFLTLAFRPISFMFIITLPLFITFPLGTVFLLNVVKANPSVSQIISANRGLLAARIVASLQRFRYRLTTNVRRFVRHNLFKAFHPTSFVLGLFVVFPSSWFFVLPLLFLFLLLFIICLLPFFALLSFVSFTFSSVFGIVTTSSTCPRASYVPPFYALTTSSDRWSRMVVFAFFGVIFGGLHCIGWSFNFPTFEERTLWRYTSFAITVIPLIVAPIDFFLTIRDIESCGKIERVGFLCLDLIMTVLLFVYVPARLSLIAQALALLRSQPANALIAVDWTKYFPHLFS